MERVDEDAEEEEEVEPRGYEAAVRERELATQKARIVSQMAGQPPRTNVGEERERMSVSPRKMALAPATTLPPSRVEMEVHDMVAPAKTRDGRPSLFDTFAKTLENAIARVEAGEVFTSPRKCLWIIGES
jgi:polo-like kinase 1